MPTGSSGNQNLRPPLLAAAIRRACSAAVEAMRGTSATTTTCAWGAAVPGSDRAITTCAPPSEDSGIDSLSAPRRFISASAPSTTGAPALWPRPLPPAAKTTSAPSRSASGWASSAARSTTTSTAPA